MDIETGKKFVRERNYLEAEKIFLNLLNKDVNLMLVNYFLGIIYFELQNYKKSKFHYDNSLKFNPNSKEISDEEENYKNICRLMAQVPILAAYFYRHSQGLPIVPPDNSMSYSENFLNMLFQGDEKKLNPVLVDAMDTLLILHADHEQNCSASVMRNTGSSEPDPYSAVASATAALYGPLHGGANEAVLEMLTNEIKTVDNIPEFLEKVQKKEALLMGFGHRVYKSYDPRAKYIKKAADSVFEITGTNPLLDIALELESIALSEDYFIQRNLYPYHEVSIYKHLIQMSLLEKDHFQHQWSLCTSFLSFLTLFYSIILEHHQPEAPYQIIGYLYHHQLKSNHSFLTLYL